MDVVMWIPLSRKSFGKIRREKLQEYAGFSFIQQDFISIIPAYRKQVGRVWNELGKQGSSHFCPLRCNAYAIAARRAAFRLRAIPSPVSSEHPTRR